MELLISGLGNGERLLVSLVPDVASLHEVKFFSCIFSRSRFWSKFMFVCLWLRCFHVSFFSCFLRCSVSLFLFIDNRKAVTPQGFPRSRLQHWCPLIAPSHGGSNIFAMCYIPSGVFILPQKLRPNATCCVILIEKCV